MTFPVNMKTGFDLNGSLELGSNITQKIESILMTLMEKALVLAATYTEAASRSLVTCEDIIYALQWCAHDFFLDEHLEESFDKNLEIIQAVEGDEVTEGDEEEDDEEEDEEDDDEEDEDEDEEDEEEDDGVDQVHD